MARPIVGAQLFTVREFIKTMPDIRDTMGKLVKIGYTTVELSGNKPDLDIPEFARAVEDAGLSVAATHISWPRFLNELDTVIEEHRTLKCVHPAIGGLSKGYFSADGVRKFIDEVVPVAEKLAEAGMDFSYHNHNREFVRCDGATWLETLYDNTSPQLVKAELDTYWVQSGGGEPSAWIKRCAGRIPVLHLKDMRLSPDLEQQFAEVGEGNLNWPEILKAAEESGVEYLIVEQDQCYDLDPFESLAVSYRNLQAMGYA